jgi:hypothetical protein
MSDLLVTPRGTSRAAAAAAALSSGFIIAERARPYVEQGINTLKRAYTSLRDYRQVQYGPGSGRFRREQQLARKRIRRERESVKRKLDFDQEVSTLTLPSVDTKNTMGDSVQFRRSYDRVGRKRRRTASQLFNANIGRMDEVVYRWQQVSGSLLGPGNQIIAYGKAPAPATGYVCPLVFSSLTNVPLFTSNLTYGAQRAGLYRLTYEPTTKSFGMQYYRSQDKDAAQTVARWQLESGTEPALATSTVSPEIFHKWTEIRMNLYGCAYAPLTYEILVVTGMELDMSIFDYASGGTPIFESTNLNAFLRDQCKDYIGNPIVGSSLDRKDFKGKYKIIRRKVITISPLSYHNGAIAKEGLTSGIDASNVRNVNMFIRHDRFRNYAWSARAIDQDLQSGLDGRGFDTQDISQLANDSCLSDVDRDQRVYLFVKCSAGRAYEAPEFDIIPAEVPISELSQTEIPVSSGSFDIVMRNCFRYDKL